MKDLIQAEHVQKRIFLVRGLRVMLDRDLAELYEVTTFNLNKAVRRNINRFPSDFMFQLEQDEYRALIFQIGISKGRGGSRHLPCAFTEQGVAMLSSVLKGDRAARVNVAIMRAFVKLREAAALHKQLARHLQRLEKRVTGHDARIKEIFGAIRALTAPPFEAKPRIGFNP